MASVIENFNVYIGLDRLASKTSSNYIENFDSLAHYVYNSSIC